MKKTFITLLSFLLFTISASAQLLYKVSGGELTKPSYIMGTYHLANVNFADSVPGLRKAMADCEQVYGELDMTKIMNNPTSTMQMQQAMMLPQGETLDKYLNAEQIARLNAFITKHMGVEINNPAMAQVKQMKPAALSTTLQVLLFIKEEGGFNPQQQFDTYFLNEAQKQNKPIGGLETLDYQMNVLYGVPLQRQAEQLMCLVDNADYNISIAKRTIKAYYAQDMAAIEKLNDEKLHNSCDATPAEEDALIYTRNANWAKVLPTIMKAKSTLVAVGCLHLPTKRGLLQLLRNAGYKVEPVK